jgi:hypothetical protein
LMLLNPITVVPMRRVREGDPLGEHEVAARRRSNERH